ncbi:MAG: CpaF family protein [Clostridiales bacterium]|nr:CpaF family protein [Clostridiales bacterium]
MDEWFDIIRRQVLMQMDLTHELTDEEILELIAQITAESLSGKRISLRERADLQRQVFHSLRRLDVLQDLVDDPDVTEIMVNGPSHIFYEKGGEVYASDKKFSSAEKLSDVIQQIVGRHNRVVNQASPIVDTRLPDGSRVNIVLCPVALDGAAVTIRKFPRRPLLMDDLVAKGSLSESMSRFLKILVEAKYSLFISGGTGSGKTTFLNALSQHIPTKERIITIEDSAELQIQGIPNLVRMETRNANVEGLKAIGIRELIRTALRMRPDRIIVGECRGAEAFDMLQAMNTGHDGSLSTGHGNSCKDMIARLEMMVRMGMDLPLESIRQQIVSGIDVMVYLGRCHDGSRRTLDIVELDGMEGGQVRLNPIYHFNECRDEAGKTGGHWERAGSLRHRQKLLAAGFTEEDLDGL